jgi:hypothetical protein
MNSPITIKHQNFSWLIIDRPGRKQIEWLEKNCKYAKDDVHNCLPPLQRPN